MKRPALILVTVLVLVIAALVTRKKLLYDASVRRTEDLRASIEAEIGEYEALDRARPPLFLPAEDGRAWDHYRRAFALQKEIDNDLEGRGANLGPSALYDWQGAPHLLTEEAERYVELLAPVLELARQGVSTRDRGVPSDLRRGCLTRDLQEDDIPSGLPWKVILARAVLSVSHGDAAAGVDWVLIGDRMAADLMCEGPALEILVGFARRAAAAEALAALVGAGRLPATEVDRVEVWAQTQLESPPPTWALVEGCLLQIQVDLLRAAEGNGLFGGIIDPSWYERILGGRIDAEQIEALDALEGFREEIPALKRAHGSGEQTSLAAATAMRAKFIDRSIHHTLVSGTAATFVDFVPNLPEALHEMRDLVLVNAALFRHRKREGRDPSSIAEIVPEGVRRTTKRGDWSWRSDPSVPHPWIGRGPEDE